LRYMEKRMIEDGWTWDFSGILPKLVKPRRKAVTARFQFVRGADEVKKEVIETIKQELDKAREDVLIELQKEFSEFGVPDDVRYTQPLFYINEVIEKKLSKLKTKEDGK